MLYQFSLRIDQTFSPKDQFLARFSLDNLNGPTTNPDQTAIDPQFAVEYIDKQRNVMGRYTRTVSPRLILKSLISITRSTPGFPTKDYTDPAVKFNDSLFEAFNSAAGSVMQAYGNLFQGKQSLTFTTGNHTFKAGVEARLNRDTTYFGISPNGEYAFGGGTAAPAAHPVGRPGAPLPAISDFSEEDPSLIPWLCARADDADERVALTVVAVNLPNVWWPFPVLVLSALQNGVLEEILVIGYLRTRLERLGVRPSWAVAISATLRGSPTFATSAVTRASAAN